MKFLISIFFGFALTSLANAMTFKEVGTGGNCSTCEWIAAEGEITAETPGAFEQFMAD